MYTRLLSICMYACAGRNQASLQDGYDVLKRMKTAGVSPTCVTYSALMAVVAGAARHGKANAKDGEGVLEKMAEANLKPDVITYNALLAGRSLRVCVCVCVCVYGNG
jgi:hypothetical protein